MEDGFIQIDEARGAQVVSVGVDGDRRALLNAACEFDVALRDDRVVQIDHARSTPTAATDGRGRDARVRKALEEAARQRDIAAVARAVGTGIHHDRLARARRTHRRAAAKANVTGVVRCRSDTRIAVNGNVPHDEDLAGVAKVQQTTRAHITCQCDARSVEDDRGGNVRRAIRHAAKLDEARCNTITRSDDRKLTHAAGHGQQHVCVLRIKRDLRRAAREQQRRRRTQIDIATEREQRTIENDLPAGDRHAAQTRRRHAHPRQAHPAGAALDGERVRSTGCTNAGRSRKINLRSAADHQPQTVIERDATRHGRCIDGIGEDFERAARASAHRHIARC